MSVPENTDYEHCEEEVIEGEYSIPADANPCQIASRIYQTRVHSIPEAVQLGIAEFLRVYTAALDMLKGSLSDPTSAFFIADPIITTSRAMESWNQARRYRRIASSLNEEGIFFFSDLTQIFF
jgi:hypothetical protein